MQVLVRDNNVDQALRALKKKMQREGVFREMRQRKAYEKPSERRAREAAEAVRRARKLERKRLEREGYIRQRVPELAEGKVPNFLVVQSQLADVNRTDDRRVHHDDVNKARPLQPHHQRAGRWWWGPGPIPG